MKNEKSILFIFSGLPGVGKTTLAQQLASHKNAVYLRIDTIEQALRDLCSVDVQGEGYRLSYRIAADNLRLKSSVVADSCNPIDLTRKEWEQVAINENANFVNVEIICSDQEEHRKRVETRQAIVSGLLLPTWAEVESREYESWTKPRILIDTACKTMAESFDELLSKLSYLV
ncbi:MAG: AAA family ATPase [Planctomycetota bacterium]